MSEITLRAPHEGDAPDIAALFNLPKVIAGRLRLPYPPEKGISQWMGGIGAALMDAALDIADNWMGLVRVQREVSVENDKAVRLYGRMGFQIEGRARAGTLIAGELVDHYAMSRLRAPPVRRAADEEVCP